MLPTLTSLDAQCLIVVAQAGVGSVAGAGGNAEVVLSAAAEAQAVAGSRVLGVTLNSPIAEAGRG